MSLTCQHQLLDPLYHLREQWLCQTHIMQGGVSIDELPGMISARQGDPPCMAVSAWSAAAVPLPCTAQELLGIVARGMVPALEWDAGMDRGGDAPHAVSCLPEREPPFAVQLLRRPSQPSRPEARLELSTELCTRYAVALLEILVAA